MKQILITKEKIWKSVNDEAFLKEFCCFQSVPHTDKIPFRLLFCMHDATSLVAHYLHQLTKVLYSLRESVGIELNELTIDNVYIVKTEKNKSFYFILNESIHLMMHCPYGYHIYLCGFENSLIRHKRHPFLIHHLNNTRRPYKALYDRIISLFEMHELHCSAQCAEKKLYKMITKYKRPKIVLEDCGDKDIVRRLMPLVDVNAGTCVPTINATVIRKEIAKMFQIFKNEFDHLRSKFTNVTNLYRLLEDWIDTFYVYKKDFFENPDMTMSVLRKILYQYMIDHKYNHISFKTFDLSRLITSIYLWSQWYEKLLLTMQLFDHESSTDDLSWIGCFETIVDEDKFDMTSELVEVFDIPRRKHSKIRLGEDTVKTLCDTHSLLRAEYLKHCDDFIKSVN
jgi:hypothetical protein